MRGPDRRRELGRWGEERAAAYLEEQGLEIKARNLRLKQGEIDLLAREGETWVLVEVRTGRGGFLRHPVESVGRQKLERLRRLAAAWLVRQIATEAPLRVDLVTVEAPGWPREEKAEITWWKGVG